MLPSYKGERTQDFNSKMECKMVQPFWRTGWCFLKKLNMYLHMTKQPTSRLLSRKGENLHP